MEIKTTYCYHCRKIEKTIDVRGYNKCIKCVEIIDRVYWSIASNVVVEATHQIDLRKKMETPKVKG